MGVLAKMFKIARPYTMFIPLYGCLWSMCRVPDRFHRRRGRE